MKKNTYIHFEEEESIIYIWSKFQLDTCMFDSNILLTKFGPGYLDLVPEFIPSPNNKNIKVRWKYEYKMSVMFYKLLNY